MGRKMGGRFRREGIYVCLWLIHVDVWQKPIQFCKAIVLQLKNKEIKNKRVGRNLRLHPVNIFIVDSEKKLEARQLAPSDSGNKS